MPHGHSSNGHLAQENLDPPEIDPASGLSTASEACSLVCRGASPSAIERLEALAFFQPSILNQAKIFHDERGAPKQAFPALALAAIQGADPEGWVSPLISMGASFDAKLARAQARMELLDMAGPRGGALTELNARCESLSIWTLACAEAQHPHSALRAIEKTRHASPQSLAPLASELARFSDPARFDKPSIHSKARCGAFFEACRAIDGFAGSILPQWIRGPRGDETALIATEVAAALSPLESILLHSALSNDQNPACLAYCLAIEKSSFQRAQLRKKP